MSPRLDHLAAAATLGLVAVGATLDAEGGSDTLPPGPQRVTRVWVEPVDDSLTRVVILGDRPFQPFTYRVHTIDEAPPRVVVRLRGISGPPPVATLGAPDGPLRRVRLGQHPETDPPQLHVVLDLASATARVVEARHEGQRLVVTVARPQGTARHPESDPPAPPVAGRFGGEPRLATQAWTVRGPAAGSTTGRPSLCEVVLSPRGDGSSLLRITTSRPVAGDQIRLRPGAGPRELVVELDGVVLGGTPPAMEPGHSTLTRISADPVPPKGATPRVRLRLELPAASVEVLRLAHHDVHLVLHLGPAH